MKQGQKPLSDLLEDLTMKRKDVNVMVNYVLTLDRLDLVDVPESPFQVGRQIIRDYSGH